MLNRILIALALLGFITEAQADKVGPRFQANTFKPGEQERPVVAALAGGGFVATWMSEDQDGSIWGVYGQVYDRLGNRVGTEFRANTYWQSQQAVQSVTGLKNGGFVLTWQSQGQDGSGWGIYARRYDASARPVGVEFRVNTFTSGDQRDPWIASLADGGFVIVWLSSRFAEWSVLAQRFNAAGQRVGTEITVDKPVWLFSPYAVFPKVTGTPNGGFVVAWYTFKYSNRGPGFYFIMAQRYSATGLPLGSAIKAVTSGALSNGYANPNVVSLKNGNFVVTWNDFYSYYGPVLFGRVYSPQGILMRAFRTQTAAYTPSVTSLGNGGFIVCSSRAPELTLDSAFCRRYDSSGVPVGLEISLAEPGRDQTQSSVAGFSDGGFVVVWEQREDNFFPNYHGIFGQRFTP